jgi:hypothetical protein
MNFGSDEDGRNEQMQMASLRGLDRRETKYFQKRTIDDDYYCCWPYLLYLKLYEL